MNDSFLSQFRFPPEAMEDFINKGLTQKILDSGHGGTASSFEMSGHDKGISYRFFLTPVKMEAASEEFDMELNKEVEMIEWNVTKKHRPVERVHMLPDQLLKFRKEKCPNGTMLTKFPLECVGGALKEAYMRFREGKGALGLPLSQWNKCNQAQAATLVSEGIHTVEQLAARPRDSLDRFPNEFKKLFEEAVHWVNAQTPMVDIQKNAEAMMELKQILARLSDENQVLREQNAQILDANGAAVKTRKPRGPNNKIQIQDNPIEA